MLSLTDELDIFVMDKFKFQTCQMLVGIAPCNSLALQMLGNAQLAQYDNDPDSDVGKEYMEEAKASFKASIAMEGKVTGGEPPAELTGKYVGRPLIMIYSPIWLIYGRIIQ